MPHLAQITRRVLRLSTAMSALLEFLWFRMAVVVRGTGMPAPRPSKFRFKLRSKGLCCSASMLSPPSWLRSSWPRSLIEWAEALGILLLRIERNWELLVWERFELAAT